VTLFSMLYDTFVMIGIVTLVGLFGLICVTVCKAVCAPRNGGVMLGEYQSLVFARKNYGPTRYRESVRESK